MECSTKRSTQWWKPTPPKQTWRQMSPKNATLDEFSFEHTRFGGSGSLWPKHSSKCGSDPPFRSKILPTESYSFGASAKRNTFIKWEINYTKRHFMPDGDSFSTNNSYQTSAWGDQIQENVLTLMKRMVISLLYCCIPFSVPFPASGLNQHVLPFCLVQWK